MFFHASDGETILCSSVYQEPGKPRKKQWFTLIACCVLLGLFVLFHILETAFSGAWAIAWFFYLGLATVNLLKRLIGQSKWSNAAELIELIKGQGQLLNSKLKSEVTVCNLFRRVLKLVREEYLTSLAGNQEDGVESLAKMVKTNTLTSNFTTDVPDLRSKVIESIEELMTELEACSEEISAQALEHIHANEVILRIGRSRTVELFLKQAAKERKFQVIVAESAPSYQGQKTATSLAKAKIQTTVITDSAVFAMMSRVNKV